jgi:hypothetical protein
MTRRERTADLKTATFTFDAAMRRVSYIMTDGGVAVLIFGVLIGPRPFVIEAWQRRRHS